MIRNIFDTVVTFEPFSRGCHHVAVCLTKRKPADLGFSNNYCLCSRKGKDRTFITKEKVRSKVRQTQKQQEHCSMSIHRIRNEKQVAENILLWHNDVDIRHDAVDT